MVKWFSKILLFLGFTLLLYHGITPHHHADEDDTLATHARHHPHDPLEHVKIEHIFFHEFDLHFDFQHAAVTILPVSAVAPGTRIIQLPAVKWVIPEGPDPLLVFFELPVLRGPPAYC